MVINICLKSLIGRKDLIKIYKHKSNNTCAVKFVLISFFFFFHGVIIIFKLLSSVDSLNVVFATFLLVCFVCLKESSLERRKNVFYFISKALFVLEITIFYIENNYNPSTNPFLFLVGLSLFSTRAFSKLHFFFLSL